MLYYALGGGFKLQCQPLEKYKLNHFWGMIRVKIQIFVQNTESRSYIIFLYSNGEEITTFFGTFPKASVFLFCWDPVPSGNSWVSQGSDIWVAQILDLLLNDASKHPSIYVPNDQYNGRKQRITISFNNSKYIRLKIISTFSSQTPILLVY